MNAPQRVGFRRQGEVVDDGQPLTRVQRHMLNVNDAKLRRCSCCGEWAWHLDPCTVCATPAAPPVAVAS